MNFFILKGSFYLYLASGSVGATLMAGWLAVGCLLPGMNVVVSSGSQFLLILALTSLDVNKIFVSLFFTRSGSPYWKLSKIFASGWLVRHIKRLKKLIEHGQKLLFS